MVQRCILFAQKLREEMAPRGVFVYDFQVKTWREEEKVKKQNKFMFDDEVHLNR